MRREEEERRRIAAISGQLAIDAMPWGVITEIRGADGALVPLDGETQTPFVKTVVEGRYTVKIRNDAGQEQTRQVDVRRQQIAVAQVDFGQMSVDEYFEKSGW